MYFEAFRDVTEAIAREKQLKGYGRVKKVALVVRENPDWLDLSAGWIDGCGDSSLLSE
jgi:putative endonuclease